MAKMSQAEQIKQLQDENAQLQQAQQQQQRTLQTMQQQLTQSNQTIEATKSKAFDAITSRDERIKASDGFLLNIAQFLGVEPTQKEIGKAIEALKQNALPAEAKPENV